MKRKLITTMALFVALALTACGGKGGGKWESNATKHWHEKGGKKTDEAAHIFEEDVSKAVAATCSAEGKKIEICKVCGYEKETKVNKLAHTFGDWSNKDGAYCGLSEREHECSVCHAKESEQLAIVQHTWAKKGDGPTGDGGVEYDIMECSECHKTAYFVAANKATLSSGASTKTAPTDCIKMSPDGSYMTVDFKVAEAKTGTFMLRGAMDYWYESGGGTTNENKTYYDENNDHTDASTKTGNFKLEVGLKDGTLTNVELPDNTALKFSDMLPETVNSTEGGHNWSIIGDCIVGKASLAVGVNTIKFTRVDSYNLAIHDFVFVLDA